MTERLFICYVKTSYELYPFNVPNMSCISNIIHFGCSPLQWVVLWIENTCLMNLVVHRSASPLKVTIMLHFIITTSSLNVNDSSAPLVKKKILKSMLLFLSLTRLSRCQVYPRMCSTSILPSSFQHKLDFLKRQSLGQQYPHNNQLYYRCLITLGIKGWIAHLTQSPFCPHVFLSCSK